MIKKIYYYKPLLLEADDGIPYEMNGFFSYKYDKKGNLTGKPVFCSLETGEPDREAWSEREDWRYLTEKETSKLSTKQLSNICVRKLKCKNHLRKKFKELELQ